MKAGAGNNTLLTKLRSRFDSLLGEVCDYQKGGGRLLRIYTLKFSLFLVALHLFSFVAPAQVYTDTLSIYFPQGKSAFDRSYAGNGERYDTFITYARHIIDGQNGKVHSIHFEVTCSPEGSQELNNRLVNARSQNVLRSLERSLNVKDVHSEVVLDQLPWNELLSIVSSPRGSSLPDRDKCIDVLARAVAEGQQASQVRTLVGEGAWSYMLKEFFPELRRFRVILFVDIKLPEIEFDYPSLDLWLASQSLGDVPVERFELSDPPIEVIPMNPPAVQTETLKNTSVYFKTNAVALSMLVSNFALEVTLSDRLSLNIPMYYSGLDWFSRQTKFRTVAFLPELRYNFQTPEQDAFVKGLYLGLHAGVAWYNFAFGGDWRIQDADGKSPALGGGLSLGYRLPLSRRVHGLGIEFNFGAGVYSLNYDKFYNEADGPVAQKGIREVRLLPDAIGISLYYRFDNYSRKGGRSER